MQPISFKGNSEFNVLYFSDIHGKSENLKHLKTAVDEFDRENKNKNTLKLAGGDLTFASDLEPNILMLKFMNLIGLDASSVGNHEIEGGNYWAQAIAKSKSKFKLLSANLNFSRKNEIEKKIAKSTIIEKKGEKVGLIGITAIDSLELNFKGDFNDFVTVKNFNKTLSAVKNEVKELEKQGINKIFLLAHTGEKSKSGFEYYKKLAEIGGIDVIIGGHDHREIDKWFTSNRGEPVKVVSTEAGNDWNPESKDLGTFGTLKAVFDDNGILIERKCKNSINKTNNYNADPSIYKLEEKILQNNKVIGYSKNSLECQERKTKENPTTDLLADAMLWATKKLNPNSDVQIALINSGEIKGDILKGDVRIKDVKNAFRFTHNVTLVETKLTKKQLVDALNWGVQTTTFPKQTLGLLQVGGLRYTVGKDNKVKDIYLIDKKGNLLESIDKAPNDKEYKIIYDTYLMNGTGGMSSLKKNDKEVKMYPYNHQSVVLEYIKKHFANKPIEVQTGRIEIEPKETKSTKSELALLI